MITLAVLFWFCCLMFQTLFKYHWNCAFRFEFSLGQILKKKRFWNLDFLKQMWLSQTSHDLYTIVNFEKIKVQEKKMQVFTMLNETVYVDLNNMRKAFSFFPYTLFRLQQRRNSGVRCYPYVFIICKRIKIGARITINISI